MSPISTLPTPPTYHSKEGLPPDFGSWQLLYHFCFGEGMVVEINPFQVCH